MPTHFSSDFFGTLPRHVSPAFVEACSGPTFNFYAVALHLFRHAKHKSRACELLEFHFETFGPTSIGCKVTQSLEAKKVFSPELEVSQEGHSCYCN